MTLLGHDVTIFERESEAGGMLRYGIPEFRLPRDILRIELHNALRLGVTLRTGTGVGNGKGEVPLSQLRSEMPPDVAPVRQGRRIEMSYIGG